MSAPDHEGRSWEGAIFRGRWGLEWQLDNGAFQANWARRRLIVLGGERRLVDVGDGDSRKATGCWPEFFGDPREQDMPLVHRVERAREQHGRRGRRQQHLAVGLDGDAVDLAGEESVDRVRGGGGRFFVMLVPAEQALRRRGGEAAGAGQPQDDRSRNELFLAGAVASALGEDDGAMRDAGGAGGGDVKAVLAPARAVADEGRRRAEADQIGGRGHQPRGAGPDGLCHRGGGVGAARLLGVKAEQIL